MRIGLNQSPNTSANDYRNRSQSLFSHGLDPKRT
jgi:hypothetical protein